MRTLTTAATIPRMRAVIAVVRFEGRLMGAGMVTRPGPAVLAIRIIPHSREREGFWQFVLDRNQGLR